jgi:hypothetical protein
MEVSFTGFLPSTVRRCPRCGYRGDGIPYFRRPSHIALLVGISVFTYGIAGLAYWLLRRNRFVCPNCGLPWHDYAQSLPQASEIRPRLEVASERDPPLPHGGLLRRLLGGGLVLLGALLVVIGIAEGAPEAVGVGSGIGATGTGSLWWGLRALNERRKALMQRLQQKVLRLATHRGGTLTVTEVAAELNLSLPAAEKVLIAMDDGFRVRSDISSEGVLFYEFPEVKHRKLLEPGPRG